MSDIRPLTPGASDEAIRYRYSCTRAKRTICYIAVLFGLVSLAAIAVGIAAPEIKAFVRTVNLDYLNPNLTWSEHFDGWFNDRVTMELFDDEYRPFMVLYAFPRLPGLDLHRKYYWSNPQEVLFRGQFTATKVYLNAGSRINFSFCRSAGVQVLVIQYNGFLIDPDTQGEVKLKVELPRHGNSCDNISYHCVESAAYQFVVRPWNDSFLSLKDIELIGDTMQYDLSGASDSCSISLLSQDDSKCSVSLERDKKTEVVLDVGNILHPGEINIGVKLTCTLRKDTIGIIAGSTMGCAVLLAVVVILICHINARNLTRRRTASIS